MTDESNGPQDTPKTSGSMKKPPNWLGRQLWMGPSVAEAREKTFAPGKPGFAWFDLARQLGDDVVETTGKNSWRLFCLTPLRSVCWFARTWNVRVRFPAVGPSVMPIGRTPCASRWGPSIRQADGRASLDPDSFAWAGSRRRPGETDREERELFASAVRPGHWNLRAA